MKRRLFAALAAAALATVAAPSVLAQDRTMKILVGFPPGGSADVIARLLAQKMAASLNQPVIVDNKPGAAGRLVLGELKRAAPDGQTLVLSPSGAMVIAPWLYSNIGYDPIKDFTPVSRIVTFDFAVTARMRTLPALWCSMVSEAVSTISGIWPPIRSCAAGAPPR